MIEPKVQLDLFKRTDPYSERDCVKVTLSNGDYLYTQFTSSRGHHPEDDGWWVNTESMPVELANLLEGTGGKALKIVKCVNGKRLELRMFKSFELTLATKGTVFSMEPSTIPDTHEMLHMSL